MWARGSAGTPPCRPADSPAQAPQSGMAGSRVTLPRAFEVMQPAALGAQGLQRALPRLPPRPVRGQCTEPLSWPALRCMLPLYTWV